MPRFHLYNYLFRLVCLVVYNCDYAIDTPVTPFLPLFASFLPTKWLSTNKRQCPPLKLVAVCLCQIDSSANILWLTSHIVFDIWEHGFKPILHKCDSKMC